MFQGQQWGTVCKENFNEMAAISICRQLGYTGAVAVTVAKYVYNISYISYNIHIIKNVVSYTDS